jgi:hypothetical protein
MLKNNNLFFEISDFLRIVKRRILLIVLIYIPILLITFLFFKNKKKVFDIQLTINNTGPVLDAETLNDNFVLYYSNILEKNPNSIYKSLKSIHLRHVDDNTQPIYIVNLKMYDKTCVKNIVDDLIHFCNNNPYTIQHLNLQKLKRRNLMKLYKKQLDNLLLLTEKHNSINNSNSYNLHFNIFNDIALLEERILGLKIQEQETKGFLLSLDPTIPFNAKIGKSNFVLSGMLVIIELILVMGIVFFYDKFISKVKN